MLHLKYDLEADVIWVQLQDAAGRTAGDQVDEYRILHYDETDTPVAVEFLFVSKGINLDGIPHAAEIREAIGSLGRVLSAA